MPAQLQQPTSGIETQNQLASVWMKRGIALMEQGGPAELQEAVDCFDQAIKLRRNLPLESCHLFRYGLSAGWLNRGDALTRLGTETNLSNALQAYDEALVHLEKLPLNEDPRYRKRLAIAWMNRGITLRRSKTQINLVEAMRSFDNCIAILRGKSAAAIPEHNQMKASAWVNRGDTLLDFSSPDSAQARVLAKQALELLAGTEKNEIGPAEAGLKARHLLCRANANLLCENALVENEKLIAEATDAVEEGLQLASEWDARGVDIFREIATDFFRFGARVYQIYQPHFLSEFLLENLQTGNAGSLETIRAEICSSAREAIQHSVAALQELAFSKVNTPEFVIILEKLKELQIVEARLISLPRK